MNEKKLESLVPPLELCRKIPFLLFEDSVFVRILWRKSRREEVRLRAEVNDPEFAELEDNEEIIIYPAPTLAEIWNDLMEYSFDVCFSANRNDRRWYAYAKNPKTVGPGRLRQEDKYSAETAALKLWLELNEESVK